MTDLKIKHMTNLRVYADVELHKENCVNQVAKRLGIALRKLTASGKKGGVTLGFQPANQNNQGQVGGVLLLGSSWQHWQPQQNV